MHTKKLKEQYSSIYEQFFTQHTIIFSSPFVLSRSGEADAWYSWISIKQKLPLRMYAWITPSTKKWVQLGSITFKDMTNHSFITTNLHEYAPYITELQDFIQQYTTHIVEWYTLNIIAELPRWIWVWFDSVFALLVATSIHRLQNWHNHNLIHECTEITEDINNTNSSIYHIARLAHTIESQIKWYHYINWAITTSISHSSFPIISFHEDIPNLGKKELFSMDDYKCFCHPLNTLSSDIGSTTYAPIDYWLLYSGRPTLNEHTSHPNMQKASNTLLDETYSMFKDHLSTTSATRKPKFYKTLIAPHIKWENNVLQSVLWYTSFDILHNLKKLYHKGYTEEDIKKFLLSITKWRHAHNVVKKSSAHLSQLITALQQFFWYRGDLLWISYNDSNTMWGCLLFATPLEWLRKNILNTLYQAQRDFPWAELIYTSWNDWIESQWLLCEQDLAQQKASSYIDSNMLVLETQDKNMIFWSYNDLIRHQDIDIILDTVHMKIYTQGRKLTSKDLHSQTWTIEMLMTALKSIGTDISNKQLPLSSYSKSKNDMVWKIIIPLTRFIKEHLKKELPLECYGGMYDYFLRLNKHNIKFGIMRKAVEMH